MAVATPPVTPNSHVPSSLRLRHLLTLLLLFALPRDVSPMSVCLYLIWFRFASPTLKHTVITWASHRGQAGAMPLRIFPPRSGGCSWLFLVFPLAYPHKCRFVLLRSTWAVRISVGRASLMRPAISPYFRFVENYFLSY